MKSDKMDGHEGLLPIKQEGTSNWDESPSAVKKKTASSQFFATGPFFPMIASNS
jgi:hypothetical protein